MKDLLGGKGANLAEMGRLGLPVPYGFTIPTSWCVRYFENQNQWLPELESHIQKAIRRLEQLSQKTFGRGPHVLLVSVRSGARVSMPGMMETILNVGLNDDLVPILAQMSQNPRWAWDCYRRLIQMFGNVVYDLPAEAFEKVLMDVKNRQGALHDHEIDEPGLQEVVRRFKQIIREYRGCEFPQDPWQQLYQAVEAVFRSWNSPKAKTYREIHNLPHNWGTAVNVQMMVFGNMGQDSATGVLFTRDPSTGEKRLFGEFLLNAQGEDVVAGIRTPEPIHKLAEWMPQTYQDLIQLCYQLEQKFRDVQDIEFTIEKHRLWLLQTRNAKRSAQAAVKWAVDFVQEGLITQAEAIQRVSPAQLEQLLHPIVDPAAPKTPVAQGLGASPGGASGQVVFTSERAVEWAQEGKKVILIRPETSPEDIAGMHHSVGIVTARGGMTSHAAVVARGMGKPCVVGCSHLILDVEKGQAIGLEGRVIREGDWVTVDGASGWVYWGQVPTVSASWGPEVTRLLQWADDVSRIQVRANADTPTDAAQAKKLGARGIGLCRTEHMFFAPDRIDWVRRMIMAETEPERRWCLEQLKPMQVEDFKAIFKAMAPDPVTIRLLDPPLHEFIPQGEAEMLEFAQRTGMTLEDVRRKVQKLAEFNPMLGHRGSRLAVTDPEIYRMQAQAIAQAWIEVSRQQDLAPVEIMVPLVISESEVLYLKQLIEAAINEVEKSLGQSVSYQFGTMVETPRAALLADQIAAYVQFMSFGTNDLTQTTLGLSRDDAFRFLPIYVEKGLLPFDPFIHVDEAGVGALIQLAVQKAKPRSVKLGICGEHGGDPQSIEFFVRSGVDYVSCSPFRVPVARLSVAQVSLKLKDF